ncbi:MAG TPA: hypothetical protein VGR72_01495 [Candidatus Acidoferrales bacterium]|nr:hypothetical protein [Candidatus Acidoferrales bacterium]
MRALIYVTDWERVSLWRRLVCAFGRVAALLIILTVLLRFLGPPITIYFMVRWEAKKIPAVSVTPQLLTDYSVTDAPGTAVSYFGYSFEVPWDASFKTKGSQKGSTKGGIMKLTFDSGQILLLIAPANQSGLLTEIVQDRSLSMENLRPVFGDLMNRSAYDQYSALLNASPSSIRAFGPRVDAVRGVSLLTIKAIALPAGLETGAFSFQLPDKRGFQIGDPRKSRRISLKVFDMNGHNLEIECGTARDGIKLTQPELNRILKTLHIITSDSATTQSIKTKALQN